MRWAHPGDAGDANVQSWLRTTEFDRDPSLRSLQWSGPEVKVKRDVHRSRTQSRGSHRRFSQRAAGGGTDPGQCSPVVQECRQMGA